MTNGYECWIWTELLAFDCEAPDCGAAAYLERIGFVPTGISFLLSSPDFILDHRGMAEEYPLYPDVCARFGHAGNEERRRQKWTNFTLKKLIDGLRAKGIKVFVSVFILNLNDRFHREYVSRHPEIRMGDKVYGLNNAISMLAQLDDGTLFEDVFMGKLTETVRDYGFDGWHGADGQGPGWNLSHSDCSDNFVRQFAAYLGPDRLPSEILEPAGEDEAGMSARIDRLWREFHDEWAAFTSRRWVEFWSKAAAAMHTLGKEVMINSPFAKSIFESIYYFGLDYRDLRAARIDYLLTESVTTSCALNYGGYERVFDFSAMIAEMRAVLPEMKLIVMPGVKDVVESYDALRHAPCRLERDIFANCNQHIWRDGAAHRAADGMMVCLGDGLTSEEWLTLNSWRETAFGFNCRRAGELAFLTEAAMFTPLIRQYAAHGTPPPYRWIGMLTETQSLDISTAVTPDQLENCDMPLLAPDFDLLAAPTLERLLRRRTLTVLIGNIARFTPPPDAAVIACRIADGYDLGAVIISGNGATFRRLPDAAPSKFDWRPTFYRYIKNRIPQMEVPAAFLDALGDELRRLLPPSPLQNPGDGVRLMRFFAASGRVAALLSLTDTYVKAEYRVAAAERPEKISAFPYAPPGVAAGMLTLRDHMSPLHLPPRGVAVFAFADDPNPNR